MEFAARYQDGIVAEVRDVLCVIDLAADPVALVILDARSREVLDRWPANDAYLLHTRMVELRIANMQKPAGARLAVTGIADMRSVLNLLPALSQHQRRDFWLQARTIVLATCALASVVVAYLFGIPLLADRLVAYVPPAWETRIGDTAAVQIERQLTGGKGYVVCDPNPDSVANRAIARFAEATFAGLDTPFHPVVTVVRSETPNAFALPGGRAYYLSALVQASRSPDEFAGVLAHELGHVYYRHGMQSLIATSTTGLLVGFVLGDLTGLSVAGAIGSSLIDNRFSRQDEAQADRFAAETAHRLGYTTKGLADLLERVAKDDSFSRALALFSNHPLTDERRRALEALETPVADAKPAFTDVEWAAIRDMCPPPPPPALPKLAGEL
ncbi:MAG TPA: M48 family metallopeptidase [Reyranella sp.]|jgi:predicted Zn-dependent protease|nr:M48 family metallopeptidase [Reyranella sp.]